MSHFFDLTGPILRRAPPPRRASRRRLPPRPGPRLAPAPQGPSTSPPPSASRSPPPSSSSPRTSPSPASRPSSAPSRWPTPSCSAGTPADTFIIMGEQSDASSVVFYTHNFFHGKPAAARPPPLRPARRRLHPPLGFLLHRRPRHLHQRPATRRHLGQGRTQVALRPGPEPAKSRTPPRRPPLPRPNRSRQRPLDRPPPPLTTDPVILNAVKDPVCSCCCGWSCALLFFLSFPLELFCRLLLAVAVALAFLAVIPQGVCFCPRPCPCLSGCHPAGICFCTCTCLYYSLLTTHYSLSSRHDIFVSHSPASQKAFQMTRRSSPHSSSPSSPSHPTPSPSPPTSPPPPSPSPPPTSKPSPPPSP